jgi:predicted nucleic acid-binding protein
LKVFFDTNVLVYAAGVELKSNVARELLLGGGVVSVQVLNEFINVARKKMRHDWPTILHALASYRNALDELVPITIETHQLGLHVAARHGFHIYDSMIIASASLSGCGILYTEDLTDGAVIAGVQIRNPFKSVPVTVS